MSNEMRDGSYTCLLEDAKKLSTNAEKSLTKFYSHIWFWEKVYKILDIITGSVETQRLPWKS